MPNTVMMLSLSDPLPCVLSTAEVMFSPFVFVQTIGIPFAVRAYAWIDNINYSEINFDYDKEKLQERLAKLSGGVAVLKDNEKSFSLKTVADGQNSVNSWALRIPFPWLVFNEKIKVNSVFLLDTTVVSDFVLLLFGGSISKGNIFYDTSVYGSGFPRLADERPSPLVCIA
ncbi:unnamed protein product [Lactuca saligna]|uniref:Uncharacterized protein n=1 Tax=Lactuca saligna TaxID=75948 RepID=A0AA35YZC8_LACSI|nr:unnamed protein product [Lactuca saligna]